MCLLGEELQLDRLIVDNEVQDLPQPTVVVEDGRETYVYEFDMEYDSAGGHIAIMKRFYFPYVISLFDYDISGQDVVDLGHVGLLKETSSDAFVLTWGAQPRDLDARLQCPGGGLPVGVSHPDTGDQATMENEYAKMSIESTVGYGPETAVIKKWMKTDDISSNGRYEFYVNWYKD